MLWKTCHSFLPDLDNKWQSFRRLNFHQQPKESPTVELYTDFINSRERNIEMFQSSNEKESSFLIFWINFYLVVFVFFFCLFVLFYWGFFCFILFCFVCFSFNFPLDIPSTCIEHTYHVYHIYQVNSKNLIQFMHPKKSGIVLAVSSGLKSIEKKMIVEKYMEWF